MMARQPLRSLRVPDHIWDAAMARAGALGESLSSAVNRFLAVYGGVDAAPALWFTDPGEVLTFGFVLSEADMLDTADDVLYYIDKPHKWDELHEEWIRLDRPRAPEKAPNASSAWKAFIEHAENKYG